jgi:serine/threonine protein kinase
MMSGAKVGNYLIGDIIGEGDIARVYRGVDSQTGQSAALKILREDSPVPDAHLYFRNEIVILSHLEHPHIPKAYDASGDDPAYIALELIDGKDAESLLAQLPEGEFFRAEDLVQWGAQICDALAYLHNHAQPVAFRDLKPSHVMVDRQGKAWLVDYNLAKMLPSEKLLAGADLAGTEGFAAPEQYMGMITPLVDIYGLGATLHQLMTRIDPRHERPFTYAPPRAINPLLPKALAGVIMKALAYEPEDRFPNAAAFKAALLACL